MEEGGAFQRCIEQRRGRSGKGRFLIQASRWILLPCIKMQKTGGGDRFGLKIIFKEVYPNSKNRVVTCLQNAPILSEHVDEL